MTAKLFTPYSYMCVCILMKIKDFYLIILHFKPFALLTVKVIIQGRKGYTMAWDLLFILCGLLSFDQPITHCLLLRILVN